MITHDYLQKELWVSFRPLWKVLASVDVILLLLTKHVEYKFSDKYGACLYSDTSANEDNSFWNHIR